MGQPRLGSCIAVFCINQPNFLEPISVLNRVPTQQSPQLCHWHTHTQLKPLWVPASTVTKFVVLSMQDHSKHLKVWQDTHSVPNVSEYNQRMAAIHKNPATLGQPCQLVWLTTRKVLNAIGIILPSNMKIHPPFHVSQFKPPTTCPSHQ